MGVTKLGFAGLLCLVIPSVATILGSKEVLADQTYYGGICQPYDAFDAANVVTTPLHGIQNRSSNGIQLICPTPIDHNINNANWTIRVEDLAGSGSGTGGFTCIGTIFNANGDIIAQTPPCGTSTLFQGFFTLSCDLTTGGYSNTFSHVMHCIVPDSSDIRRITLN